MTMNETQSNTIKQLEMVGKERPPYPPKGYGVFLQSDRIHYFLVMGHIVSTKLIILEEN